MTQHKDLTGADLHINKLHATTHQDGGTDEISLTGLAGAPLLGSATTAVTQSAADNTTKVATTAYADAAAAAAAGTYTDEKAQDAVGAMVDTTIVYTDATPLLSRAALTGDVTASAGSNVTTVKNDLALGGNPTAATQTAGNNTTRIATTAFVTTAVAGVTGSLADADYGDITVSGSGTVMTIDNAVVTGAKIASSVALAGSPTTTTQSAADNSTKLATTAYADAAAAAATGTYTDEKAQDAVGAMVDTTLVYTDATPLLVRAALTGDVTASAGSNTTAIASSVALGGNPTTTTQSAGNNSTRIATTAYVDAAVVAPSSGGVIGPAGPKTNPTDASWSWINQGSATKAVSSRDGSVCIFAPASASNSYAARIINPGSTPYTAIFNISGPLLMVDNMSYGVMFYSTGAGKGIGFQIVTVSNSLNFYIELGDTSHGWTSTVYKNATLADAPPFLALRDDGTNTKYYLGTEEENMTLVLSQARTTGITPDRVGFWCNPRSSTYDGHVTLFSYKVQSGAPG